MKPCRNLWLCQFRVRGRGETLVLYTKGGHWRYFERCVWVWRSSCRNLTRSSTRSLIAVIPSTTTRGMSVVYQGRVVISGIIWNTKRSLCNGLFVAIKKSGERLKWYCVCGHTCKMSKARKYRLAALLNCSYRFSGRKVMALYLYVLMAFPWRGGENKNIMRGLSTSKVVYPCLDGENIVPLWLSEMTQKRLTELLEEFH